MRWIRNYKWSKDSKNDSSLRLNAFTLNVFKLKVQSVI